MEKFDAIVIGAGVIGLAVARSLCEQGKSVVVVERHAHIGTETSSRNSGVIHSGIYYPPGSAKAALCVRGRELLYEYCTSRGIAHVRCGKLIVAQSSETAKLETLHRNAVRNGVHSLEWLSQADVREKEPLLEVASGLWCPETGIISVHELLTSLHGDLEQGGGMVAFRSEFVGARANADALQVNLRCDGQLMSLACKNLVNSAGLAAAALLERIDGYPRERIPERFFAKGNYFEFSGRSPFRHLVYPMPSEAGLGIHATLDIAGRLRFGPDVEWIDRRDGQFDYAVSSERDPKFYAAIREYWPDIPEGSLLPSYSGIRPKLVGPGCVAADFRIEGPMEHGVRGLVNLLGMESPGLTASLAVGEEVARRLAY